jgi:hypothetical protein
MGACTAGNVGSNCGTCGNVCGPGAVCQANPNGPNPPFSCQCAAPETYCGTAKGCVNLMTDPNNCGICGNQCGTGANCTGSMCACPAGQVNCGGLIGCVDLLTDPAHCGTCGTPCPAGDPCVMGVCTCPMGDVMCGGACSDPNTDPANCGSCGTACEQGETCSNGMCTCAAGGMMCGAGMAATCTDTQEDPDNCGACGTTCGATQACLTGKCACRPGLTICGLPGACVDTLHDALNCSACGNVCPMFQQCTDGICSGLSCGGGGRTRCGQNFALGIAGGCFTQQQLASSPLFCSNTPGLCGVPCAENQVCAQGVCTSFFVSASCTACPCPACGTGTTCCQYPGTTEAICVQGNTCPQ